MKPRTVTVTLTRLEAENLLLAAGQCFASDSALALFANRRAATAAMNGHDKIQAALHPVPAGLIPHE